MFLKMNELWPPDRVWIRRLGAFRFLLTGFRFFWKPIGLSPVRVVATLTSFVLKLVSVKTKLISFVVKLVSVIPTSIKFVTKLVSVGSSLVGVGASLVSVGASLVENVTKLINVDTKLVEDVTELVNVVYPTIIWGRCVNDRFQVSAFTLISRLNYQDE